MPETVACKACGKPMRFVRMGASGRLNPLDADPVPEGNIRVEDGQGLIVSKADREAGKYLGVPLYKSHFATCPKGPTFRKKS